MKVNIARLYVAGLAMLLALAGGGAAHAAAERLALPYRCLKSGGTVTVWPSTIRGLEIVGARASRSIELCENASWRERGGACVPLELHRFDVLCGDRRVAWSEVASAIARRSSLRVRVALASGDRSNSSRAAECSVVAAGRDAARGRTNAPLALSCGAPAPKSSPTRFAIPAGFAPIGDMAWFQPIVALEAQSASGPGASEGPAFQRVTATMLPDITPSTIARAATDHWIDTTVTARLIDGSARAELATPEAASVSPAGSNSSATAITPGLLVAFLLTAALGGMVLRAGRMEAGRHRARRLRAAIAGSLLRLPGRRLLGRYAPIARTRGLAVPEAVNASSAVRAMIADTRKQLGSLKNAGPLIDVLTEELDALSQRLAGLDVQAAESTDAARRVSPGFRNLMREIERVRRIIDSAAQSMGSARQPARLPSTRTEAYALLGLNPDAGDGTLKKVADGLRMNWHPDHARDDADRREREARIKAINAAVDLIGGKRSAA